MQLLLFIVPEAKKLNTGLPGKGEKMKRLAIFLFALGLFAAKGCSPSLVKAGDTSTVANQNPTGSGNVISRWNEIATELFPQSPGPIVDVRAYSIFHAAIHDAVNSIERRFKPYTADFSSPNASVDSAVASAAREVLLALSPENSKKIEDAYDAALAEIPDGPGKNAGIALGSKCAHSNLERRANDGIAEVNEPAYIPTHKPGDYDFTPPFDQPPLGPVAFFPGFGRITTFFIDPAKYRVPGPDSLDSKRYAADLNHVKSIGKFKSTTRTADQTEIAFFWFIEFAIWNQIANTAIQQQNLDEWEAARILALVNMAMLDSITVAMDAKYHFRFWRPYTAIRRADKDGNPSTEPVKNWRPLLWSAPNEIPPRFFIPPIPEYPSVAATSSAAAAEVLIRNLKDDVSFDVTSPNLPNVTRHFNSFSHAAKECRLSRVYGGIHFQKAINDGFHLGKKVGADVSRRLPKLKK